MTSEPNDCNSFGFFDRVCPFCACRPTVFPQKVVEPFFFLEDSEFSRQKLKFHQSSFFFISQEKKSAEFFLFAFQSKEKDKMELVLLSPYFFSATCGPKMHKEVDAINETSTTTVFLNLGLLMPIQFDPSRHRNKQFHNNSAKSSIPVPI